MRGWAQTNGFVLSWIPAARIVERSNASALLDGFEAAIRSSVYLNWYHPHGGGGYEDVGAVEAVNSMLLLSIVCPKPISPRAFCRCASVFCLWMRDGWRSQEGFLRFFPAWPLGEAASFRGLRASGAFLVNASIDTAGTVSGVSLRSEAGGRCEFLSPWAGAAAPKAVCGGMMTSGWCTTVSSSCTTS